MARELRSSSRLRCPGAPSCKQAGFIFVSLFISLLLAARGTFAGRLAFHQPGYLAACLLSRDGNHDVREWVEYHLFAGVDKIFLFDHNSSVPMIAEVSDYVAAGKVQYTYLTSTLPRIAGPEDFPNGFQGRVFGECLEQARGYYKWMMFTDMDEVTYVLDPKYGYSIAAVLRDYEHAGAVLIHRRDVGSSGVQERTPGMGQLATFTKCVNSNSKMIYHYAGSVAEYTERVNSLSSGVSGLTTKSISMYQGLDNTAIRDCLAGRRAHAAMLAANAIHPVQPFCTAEGLRRRLARKGRTQKQLAAAAAAGGGATAGGGRRRLRQV